MTLPEKAVQIPECEVVMGYSRALVTVRCDAHCELTGAPRVHPEARSPWTGPKHCKVSPDFLMTRSPAALEAVGGIFQYVSHQSGLPNHRESYVLPSPGLHDFAAVERLLAIGAWIDLRHVAADSASVALPTGLFRSAALGPCMFGGSHVLGNCARNPEAEGVAADGTAVGMGCCCR